MFITIKHCCNKEITDTNRLHFVLLTEKYIFFDSLHICYTFATLWLYSDYSCRKCFWHFLHFLCLSLQASITKYTQMLLYCCLTEFDTETGTPDGGKTQWDAPGTTPFFRLLPGPCVDSVTVFVGITSCQACIYKTKGLKSQKTRWEGATSTWWRFIFFFNFCMFREYLLWGLQGNIWNKCVAKAHVLKRFVQKHMR